MITQIRTTARINRRNHHLKICVINAERAKRSTRGQYTLEWGILVAAVVIAGVLMRDYVRGALRANVKSTEMQLNGAMLDNRP